MHNCSDVEGRIVDMVFGELGEPERHRLTVEVESCSVCLEEYRSMTEALTLFDRAVEESAPDESYWPAHHASLRGRLRTEVAATTPARVPLWRRLLTARLPVPAPAAALVLLALFVSATLALRGGNSATQGTAAAPAASEATQVRIVEVPVYRDRVVTKTVYTERARGKVAEPRQRRTGGPDQTLALRGRPGEDALFTRANLSDYQPPDEMQIRVIKRSNSDEK